VCEKQWLGKFDYDFTTGEGSCSCYVRECVDENQKPISVAEAEQQCKSKGQSFVTPTNPAGENNCQCLASIPDKDGRVDGAGDNVDAASADGDVAVVSFARRKQVVVPFGLCAAAILSLVNQ